MTDKNSILNKCNALLDKHKQLPYAERYKNLLNKCDALLKKYKPERREIQCQIQMFRTQ